MADYIYTMEIRLTPNQLKGVLLVTAIVTLFFFLLPGLPGPFVGAAQAAAAALFPS